MLVLLSCTQGVGDILFYLRNSVSGLFSFSNLDCPYAVRTQTRTSTITRFASVASAFR